MNLTNKPLVEAIFELRWQLQGKAPSGEQIDPHYKILVSRMYDRAKEEYPFSEPLATADIPERFAAYNIQYRFRKAEDGWPLIQLGPGIITLNDTKAYTWEDFRNRIFDLLVIFSESHPESSNLSLNLLMLRYIDAVKFDYGENDAFEFLRGKMKTNIEMRHKLFESNRLSQMPSSLDLRFSFASIEPAGVASLRIATGEKNGENSLVCETIFRSLGKDTQLAIEKVNVWVEDAHRVAHDWFFGMIEGDLLEEFK